MIKEHLEDLIIISKKQNVSIDYLLSQYTLFAINSAVDGFSPEKKDYELAYFLIKKEYNN